MSRILFETVNFDQAATAVGVVSSVDPDVTRRLV